MLIPLSPMDYYFLRPRLYAIHFVFEFGGRIDETRLRDALRMTLLSFPALRGQLEILSKTEAGLRILDSFDGVDLPLRLETLPEEFDPNDPDHLSKLLDPVTTVPGEKLFRLVLGSGRTRSYLSINVSHLVGDGFSVFRFLTALADTFHNREISAPSNDRSILGSGLSSPGPVNLERLFADTGYIRPRPPSRFKTQTLKIRFLSSDLEDLRREASATKHGLTTNHVLMAELLRRLHGKVALHEGKLLVRCPVDYRKIEPRLVQIGGDYFGNAVRDAVASFEPDGFEHLTLTEIAFKIRDSIQTVDKYEIRRSLCCLRDLRQQDGLGAFEELGCPGLLISNLSRMPLRQMDYGCGSPLRMIHASMNPRLAAVLPRQDGVEVYARLAE